MLQIDYSIVSCTLSQPTSFEPQLRTILNLKYVKWSDPNPPRIEIIDIKGKILVRTNNNTTWHDMGIAEQESQSSVNLGDTVQIHLLTRISPHILDKIEKLRSGNDLWFRFNPISGKYISQIGNNVNSIDTLNMQERGTPESKYPKSEWIEHLNATEFDKVELIEIPKIDLPQIPLTGHIVKFLGDANKAMNDGRYGDVLQECRKSIEALETGVKEWGKNNASTQEQNSKNELENYLTKLIGDREKATRLNELRKTLRSYLSLDPHEAEYKSIVFIRDDAKFVLYTTIGFINNILKYMVNSKQ